MRELQTIIKVTVYQQVLCKVPRYWIITIQKGIKPSLYILLLSFAQRAYILKYDPFPGAKLLYLEYVAEQVLDVFVLLDYLLIVTWERVKIVVPFGLHA